MGIRPLCLGHPARARRTRTSSRASRRAFDLIGAEFVRDVEPGEMVIIDAAGMRSRAPARAGAAADVRLRVRLLRPPRLAASAAAASTRCARRSASALAEEHPVEADVVIPRARTRASPRAIGYARRSGIPFEMGLIRSHYVGRTFIEPQQSIRHFGVRLKLNPVEPVLRGKRVVVVDDSIVRGTTSRKIVKMVRDAGAREVHLRISSPPTQWPCYYGIDTPTRRELIASSHSVDEIARYVTADSLGYLSLEGMLARRERPERRSDGYCHACFSGEYAIPFTPSSRKQMRLVGV